MLSPLHQNKPKASICPKPKKQEHRGELKDGGQQIPKPATLSVEKKSHNHFPTVRHFSLRIWNQFPSMGCVECWLSETSLIWNFGPLKFHGIKDQKTHCGEAKCDFPNLCHGKSIAKQTLKKLRNLPRKRVLPSHLQLNQKMLGHVAALRWDKTIWRRVPRQAKQQTLKPCDTQTHSLVECLPNCFANAKAAWMRLCLKTGHPQTQFQQSVSQIFSISSWPFCHFRSCWGNIFGQSHVGQKSKPSILGLPTDPSTFRQQHLGRWRNRTLRHDSHMKSLLAWPQAATSHTQGCNNMQQLMTSLGTKYNYCNLWACKCWTF